MVIYEGLTRKEEAALFIDINTTQRGVPAALLLDIKQVAEKETEQEAVMRRMFDMLSKDSASPLNGILTASESAKGKISRVTFNRATNDILKTSVMQRLNQDNQYILLKNYLRAIEQSLANPALLRRSAYFEAFCDLFDDVVRTALATQKGLKESALLEVLHPIKNIDLENLTTGGKTKITKGAISPILRNTLLGQIEVSEDML